MIGGGGPDNSPHASAYFSFKRKFHYFFSNIWRSEWGIIWDATIARVVSSDIEGASHSSQRQIQGHPHYDRAGPIGAFDPITFRCAGGRGTCPMDCRLILSGGFIPATETQHGFALLAIDT